MEKAAEEPSDSWLVLRPKVVVKVDQGLQRSAAGAVPKEMSQLLEPIFQRRDCEAALLLLI